MVNRLMQACAILGVVAGGALVAQLPALTPQAAASTAADEQMYDELLLSNGSLVRGRIIEETETKIVFELHTNFGKIETTYNKADVLSIRRDAGKMAAIADVAAPAVQIPDDKPDADDEHAKKMADPDAYKIYSVLFDGSFGSNISQTPLNELVADINAVFDDAVPNPEIGGVSTVVDPKVRDKHVVIIQIRTSPAGGGYNEIFRAEELIPIIESEIHDRGRRVIFVIDNAVDGSAFLPWVSPEMYFLPQGRMYITSDFAFFDSGDDVVDEKLIGAFIGSAEGFALRGGYTEIGPQIAKAMARSTYWFAVKWTGSTPQVMLREPTPAEIADGWEVLSDDGIDENDDTMQEAIRNPNDQLRLVADTAFRMGASQGTVEDMDDLLFQLGMNRNHVMVKNEGARILNEWDTQLERYYDQAWPGSQQRRPGELWREYQDIEVRGNFNDRRKARGQQLRILRQIRSMTLRVAESIPGIEQLISNIEVQIEAIRTAQQLDAQNR